MVTLQRIVHIKELIEISNAPRDKIYERDSSFRSAMTTLEKSGTVVVKDMHHGQFDAVTGEADERGDTHALIVMEVPKSRIIEHGKGQYLIGKHNNFRTPTNSQMTEIMREFSRIATVNGIQLYACAQKHSFPEFGVKPSKCTDAEFFTKLLADKWNVKPKVKTKRLDGQRKYCACMPCIDIGIYNPCNDTYSIVVYVLNLNQPQPLKG